MHVCPKVIPDTLVLVWQTRFQKVGHQLLVHNVVAVDGIRFGLCACYDLDMQKRAMKTRRVTKMASFEATTYRIAAGKQQYACGSAVHAASCAGEYHGVVRHFCSCN